jgi:hypothetical protein
MSLFAIMYVSESYLVLCRMVLVIVVKQCLQQTSRSLYGGRPCYRWHSLLWFVRSCPTVSLSHNVLARNCSDTCRIPSPSG